MVFSSTVHDESAPHEFVCTMAPVPSVTLHSVFPAKSAWRKSPVKEASNIASFAPGAMPVCWDNASSGSSPRQFVDFSSVPSHSKVGQYVSRSKMSLSVYSVAVSWSKHLPTHPATFRSKSK